MNFHRSLVVLLIIALSAPLSSAWAFDDDDMVFEPEDVDDDDDGMVFAPDELDDSDFDPEADMEEAIDVGVVAVPGPDLSDDERHRLQGVLRDAAREIPEINTYGDSDLRPALVDRDPEYCSREALCLASIGRSAGVQRILQARVEVQGGRYRLDIDYFDVEDRLFVAYHSSSDHSSFDDVLESVPEGVNHIFGIRDRSRDDDFVDDRDVNIPRILAYTLGAAAPVFLGTGIFFGIRFNNQEEELVAHFREDGSTSLTQREAREMQREMEASGMYANLFFGTSAVLAVASVLLFVLGPDGADADAEARAPGVDDQPWYRTVDVAPKVGDDGFGIGATWRF